MKTATITLLIATIAVVGCGRKVIVQSPPAPAPVASPSAPAPVAPAIDVTNTLAQPVNIYATQGATDTFLRQVAADSTLRLPVPAILVGATVQLKAVTADGARTYSRDNVTLTGIFVFRIP